MIRIITFANQIFLYSILPEIVGFFKFFDKIQRLVRKRSQKKNKYVNLLCV